jgi:hypothetical protein
MGISCLIWGNSVFIPLVFGSGREPKLFSILASLRVHSWLVGGRGVVDWLVQYNTVMVLGTTILAIWLCWRCGLSWISSYVIGSLAILLTYKAGHQQFYMPWLSALAALSLPRTKHDDQTPRVCMPFAVFLSIFQSIYTLGTEMRGPWQFARDNVGFISFAMGVAIIYLVMRVHRSMPKRSMVLAW